MLLAYVFRTWSRHKNRVQCQIMRLGNRLKRGSAMKSNILKISLLITLLLLPACLFANSSLEDLLAEYEEIVVVTASKKAQKVIDAPSAIYVVTQDDIHEYGANNLAEALRLVPGVEVFQTADYVYQISIRGFSRTHLNRANKVLWLVNGRSVYSDSYGGFDMRAVNVAIDEVERIEIIRGTGSALWGANAFTGIVNIITRQPKDVDGFFAKAAGGSQGQVNSNLRFGYRLSEKISAKVNLIYDHIDQKDERYAGYDSLRYAAKIDGGYIQDDKNMFDVSSFNAGLAFDLSATAKLDIYGGYADNTSDAYATIPRELTAKNYFAQADYRDARNSLRVFMNGESDWADHSSQVIKQIEPVNPYLIAKGRGQYALLAEGEHSSLDNRTVDIELQRSQPINDKMEIIAGVSYRNNYIKSNIFDFRFNFETKNEDLFAAYSQFEYRPSDQLTITGGARYDDHNIIGSHVNPKFSAVYKPSARQAIRLSAGTATRNPNFTDMYFNSTLRLTNLRKVTGLDPILNLTAESDYVLGRIEGNSTTIDAEKIKSIEFGYQANPIRQIQVGADLFYSEMTDALLLSRSGQIERIETIENIRAIFKAGSPNGNFDFLPNDMTLAQMDATIAGLTAQNNPQLLPVILGLQKLRGLYGVPKIVDITTRNEDQTIKYYGGELSFNYIVSGNLTVSGNYSYLKFIDQSEITTLPASPEHKFNFGMRFNKKPFYGGFAFSYMGKTARIPDDDAVDHWARLRKNLNLNLGYQWQKLDIFVTGYNMIQDGLQHYNSLNTIDGGEPLNRRFVAGVRAQF